MNFDKNKYKVYSWKNWMMLHWILNPGIAFNELLLGQRVPKISLEDKTIDKPRIERTLIPCPHCETLHDGRTWSTQNKTAFKNWFGLYCNNCGKIIPCLTNILSFIMLALTFPIWVWFRKRLKNKWLEKQPKRFENIDLKKIPNPFDKKGWIKTGISWGIFMFLIMSIVFPYFNRQEITLKTVFLGIIFWLISGLIYGYVLKLFFNATIYRKPKKIQ